MNRDVSASPSRTGGRDRFACRRADWREGRRVRTGRTGLGFARRSNGGGGSVGRFGWIGTGVYGGFGRTVRTASHRGLATDHVYLLLLGQRSFSAVVFFGRRGGCLIRIWLNATAFEKLLHTLHARRAGPYGLSTGMSCQGGLRSVSLCHHAIVYPPHPAYWIIHTSQYECRHARPSHRRSDQVICCFSVHGLYEKLNYAPL